VLCFGEAEYSALLDGKVVVKVYTCPISFPDMQRIPASTGNDAAQMDYLVKCVGSSSEQRGKGRKRVQMDYTYRFQKLWETPSKEVNDVERRAGVGTG
jgi:hypothetical protein